MRSEGDVSQCAESPMERARQAHCALSQHQSSSLTDGLDLQILVKALEEENGSQRTIFPPTPGPLHMLVPLLGTLVFSLLTS